RNREVVTFTSPDPLGVSFVTHATVAVTSGHALVTLTRNGVNVSTVDLNATQRDTLDVEPRMWATSATWSLIFQNQVSNDTYLTFVLEKGVVPTLFSTVPFLLFLYGATETSWWIVLRPVRDRTKSASLSVAANLDEDERVYDGTLQVSNPGPEPDLEPQREIPPATVVASNSRPRNPVSAAPFSIPSAPVSPRPAATAPAEPASPPPRPVARQPETPATLATKAPAERSCGPRDEGRRADEPRPSTGGPRRVRGGGRPGPEEREPAAEDRRGPRRRAGPPEPRADRERERQLHAGPLPVRRHPRGRAEQRERADWQGRRLPAEREAAGGGELPRLGPRRPAEQRLRPPEPRQHPVLGRRPRRRLGGVRPSHAALPQRRGGVGRPGRRARQDGARRRCPPRVRRGAQAQPR